ncbi:solute carrier family 22 member 1 [Lepeophtheirus salmonis]|uniref:Solute carrier family 22 member 15like [Strongylocentrotus purpuratus] n=1 Tax=Lepeophtheirus salmonis TaxID=72036 RepID=A0A0K2TA57_LEPSM|nr:solute carrier family 22 member 1-like [Lepeophtheirus salmonis]
MLDHDVDAEAILNEVGNFGTYQIIHSILYFFPVTFTSSFILSMAFTAAVPDFKCYSDDVYANVFNSTTMNWSPCHCKEDWFVFNQNVYKSTIASEWNLVCNKSHWLPIAQSMVFGGVLVGGFSFGVIASTFGRKLACVLSISILGICGTLSAFVSNFYLYLVFQFLAGIGESGLFQTSHVLTVENVGKNHRVFVAVLLNMFLALGFCNLAGTAWWLRDWKLIVIATAVPPLITLVYFPFLDESFRWLLSKKRYEEAEIILRKIARVNGRTFPENLSQFKIIHLEESHASTKEDSFWDLLYSPSLRFRSIVLYYSWFVASLLYYGITLHSTALYGDVYLNFFLASLAEFPGNIFSYVGMKTIGRKWTVCLSYSFMGIACLVQTVDLENYYLTIAMTFIGKMCGASAFGTIYLYTIELFPTSIRTSAVGVCSFWSYLASILTPYVAKLALYYGLSNVDIVFGISALVVGLLILSFPETKHYKIPETIKEAESFGRTKSLDKAPLLV